MRFIRSLFVTENKTVACVLITNLGMVDCVLKALKKIWLFEKKKKKKSSKTFTPLSMPSAPKKNDAYVPNPSDHSIR